MTSAFEQIPPSPPLAKGGEGDFARLTAQGNNIGASKP